MREKLANEEAIKKTILFLKRVQLDCLNNMHLGPGSQSLSELMVFFKISRRTARACFDLGILKADKEKKYIWGIGSPNNGSIDYRYHALKILDHQLKQNKKTVHYPIPDFGGIGESLKEISERLIYLSVQNEKLLKTAKNGQIETGNDLFKVEDQRLYLAGQIASSIYRGLTNSDEAIQEANNQIVKITDDLLKKLLNGRSDFIGNCFECKNPIYEGDTHCKDLESGFIVCKNHMPEPLIKM